MSSTKEIAKHFREIYFGKNWTSSNLKDNLEGVTWQQATTEVHSLNTILALVYHINYYVRIMLVVLQGGLLEGSDKYSFNHPTISSQHDWEQFLNTIYTDAETFANLIEQLPEKKLWEDFSGEKYGHFHRNLIGVIEHSYYHLGQIVLIKRLLNNHKNL